MAGRPANPDLTAPSYTPGTWATTTSYDASPNPWSEQPIKVSPPGNYFIPGQGAGAPYVNYLFNRAFVDITASKSWQTAHTAEDEAALVGVYDFVGQVQALNFHAGVTATLVDHVKFDPTSRTWLACGTGDDKFVRTGDPFVWPASTEFPGGALHSEAVWDFAFDGSSNIVACADVLDRMWEYTAGTSTWTKFSGPIGNDPDRPAVAYDPIAALWCYAALRTGGGNSDWATSSNRTTWTTRTKPTGWPSTSTSDITLTSDGAGVILARATGTTNLYTSKSTDGGVTWSAAVVTALGFTATYNGSHKRQPAPVWTGAKWVIVVPNVSTPITKVYSSTNGTTWTLIATLNTAAITRLACIGTELLCGATNTNDIIESHDGGTTWKWSTRRVAAAIVTMAASPCQFLCATDGTVLVGGAAGNGISTIT